MKADRTRKFLLETGSRNLLKLLTGVGNVVVTWWLVKQLGESGFGIYRGATASASLLALAGGGMGAAAYGLVVRAVSQDKTEDVRSLVAVSFRFLFRVGLVIMALSWPVGLGLARIYGIGPVEFNTFAATAAIAVCSLALGFFSMPFVWVIQARQKEFVLNLAHLPFPFLMPVVLISCALAIPEPWAPALGMLVMVFLGNLMCIAISLHLHPWLWPLQGSRGHGAAIVGRSGYAVAEQGAAVVLGQVLAWAVTFTGGPAAFGVIAATLTFFAFTREMLSTVSATLVAPIGTLFHQGDANRAALAWKDALCVTLLISGAVAGVLAIYNGSIITLWLGPEMNAGDLAAMLMAGSLVLSSLIHPCQAALYAADGYRERAMFLVAEAGLSALGALALGHWLGPAGCLVALVLVQGLLVLIYPSFICRRMGAAAQQCFTPVLRLGIIQTITIILLANLLPQPTHLSWPVLLANAAISGSLIVLAGWVLGLPRETKQRLLQRLWSVWESRKANHE